MKNKKSIVKGIVTLAAPMAIAGAAAAQSLSSFTITGAFSDVTIATGDGLVYDLSVGANPTFSYGGDTYSITDVIGFWVLSESADFVSGNGDFASLAGDWKEKNNNSGAGGIAGWRAANANAGLTAGESESFNFASLSPTSAIDAFGLHVRVDGTFPGSNGNTGHLRFGPVPEPATLTGLALGAAAILRKRRKV